jgi:hypothetical protein
MVTLTLAVPEDLKSKMDAFPEINWSAVARQAFGKKVADLEFLQRFMSESTLTEEDALKFGAEVSRRMAARYSSSTRTSSSRLSSKKA